MKNINFDLRLQRVTRLDLSRIWEEKDIDVWEADEVTDSGPGFFYPVFRYQNCYSYHPLWLIFHKKSLKINKLFIDSPRNTPYYSGTDTLDADIHRVGQAPEYCPEYFQRDKFVRIFSDAMIQDTYDMEARYPDHVHAVLCGGRDSLNILLLPWKKSVTAYSAQPNYPLVREFVERNRLPVTVRLLSDADDSVMDQECLMNMGHNDLRHYRWTGELGRISAEYDHKIIFWKGQMADVVLTPRWKKYAHFVGSDFNRLIFKFRNRLSLWPKNYVMNRYMKAMWVRGAMWQGFHMSFLRAICKTLFLSAYHGKRCISLIPRIHFPSVVKEDIRPLIGKYLAGKDVWYPPQNPHPAVSGFRSGLSMDMDKVIAMIREKNVIIEEEDTSMSGGESRRQKGGFSC